MLKTATLAALALVATTAGAFAHDTQIIDRTRSFQDRQIELGRATGELTRREYRALQHEQRVIAEMERNAQADGVVTGREWRAIREAQANAQRHIQHETHDHERSLWRRWYSSHR